MRNLKKIMTYVVLIVASLISIFPLYWMIAASTNNSTDILGGKLLLGTNLLVNFQNLIGRQNLGRAFANSLLFSTILSVISLAVCSIAGYAFEVYHDKVKDRLMSVLLLAMMVPFAATMIPLFKMFTSVHLQSTWIAYVLPTISTPFLIMMFRQSARSFPTELIEAARMDGLKEIQIFIKIFFPTMKSTYAAAMTVTFMNAWNNYLWPKIIMMSEKSQTMPMLVANLSSGYSIDYGVLMLGVLICSLPTGILFLVLQKSFANGIVGAVKG
ncbi:MAG: carbohydrate ABC transporter permease [Lachnospiraceae bacterium]|nr:carbohydrate ABC transporter permease [Lachnospiraceae bacterium]MDY3818080.1 carbohydrate ABC transporter permease [Lachnospiraceae bacterium]